MANSLIELGLDRLSLDERLSLVDDLWESITSQPEAYRLTEAQQADLQGRLDSYRDNPKAGSPWEIVKERLLNEN